MGRPRLISDEDVLDRAIGVFHERGYAATTLRDLSRAIGLGSAALYHRFGDKQGLFLRALARYADIRLSARLARAADGAGRLEAIGRFFDDLVRSATGDPSHRGCLLVNTAVDGASLSPQVRQLVRARLGEIERFFERELEAARAAGELAPGANPATGAESLLSMVMAIRVWARLDPDEARLRRLVTQTLALLAHRGRRASA